MKQATQLYMAQCIKQTGKVGKPMATIIWPSALN